KTHPTAEEVFDAVRKEIPSITLATVYRNLHKLADNGKILRFKINNEYRFDYDRNRPVHLVCRKCNRIFDYSDDFLCDELISKLKPSDFKVETVVVCIEGLCKECSQGR
ncbi:MAG: transcriptional repressor, partial [Candidatus Diapherotrites archaeon]